MDLMLAENANDDCLSGYTIIRPAGLLKHECQKQPKQKYQEHDRTRKHP